MKTAELTFVIFFFFSWIPLSLFLGHYHLETGDLLHLLKTLAAHLMSPGPQLVIDQVLYLSFQGR